MEHETGRDHLANGVPIVVVEAVDESDRGRLVRLLKLAANLASCLCRHLKPSPSRTSDRRLIGWECVEPMVPDRDSVALDNR